MIKPYAVAGMLAGVVLATSTEAQRIEGASRISGLVRDSLTSEPISGAVVLLMDSSGTVVNRVVSGADGRFSLQKAAVGRSVRAIHIGYRPVILQGKAATPMTIDIMMLRLPKMLGETRTRARSLCRPRKDDAFQSWEDASAGLLANVISTDSASGVMTMMSYQNVADPVTGYVQRQARSVRSGPTARPFISPVPPSSLARLGYMLEDSISRVFVAPDAAVLLDDTFAETHCFAAKPADGQHPGQTGIQFSPIADSAVDVTGTIWIDPRAAQLRSLEFSYTSLEPTAMQVQPGGFLEFETLPNGAVIVARWRLRIPELRQAKTLASLFIRQGTAPLRRADRVDVQLTRVVEVGGMVLSVHWADGQTWAEQPPIVTGRVVERGTRRGVPNATVRLAGTEDTVVTDQAGEFEMEAIPGKYRIIASTLDSSSSNTRIDSISVQIPDVGIVAADIELPRPQNARVTSVVEGRVVRSGTNDGLTDVEVAIPTLGRTVRTGDDGRFRLQDIPAGVYEIRIRHLGSQPLIDSVRLIPSMRYQQTFALNRISLLDTVRVTGAAMSLARQRFEEHRRSQLGTYLPDSLFLVRSRRTLGDVLRFFVDEIRLVHISGRTHVAINKGTANGPNGRQPVYCLATIFVDGELVFDSAIHPTYPPFDIDEYRPAEIVGAEFYSAHTRLPDEFRGASTFCGTLALWTER